MNWLILIVAGLFEVVWATALKMSNGFRNPLADAVFVAGMALSVWLLAVAMKTIPMGTAYAVWTGIGAIGGVVVGIIAFGEFARHRRAHPRRQAEPAGPRRSRRPGFAGARSSRT